MKRITAILLAALLAVLPAAVSGCARDGPGRCRTYYEIFVRSFYDTDDNGIGDLDGVRAKLGYISKDLGAGGIWLMPVHPSPSYHKYDVTDYYAIDPQYGTLDDFDELVAEAHKAGVQIIIDLVLNHTSNQHPWFQQAVLALQQGAESPYIPYYNFTQDDRGQGYSRITSNTYYESRFVSGMPDLNLDYKPLRAEIEKIVRFWLDRGVDGFRLDAVTSYYTGNQDRNIAFLAWLNETVKAYRPEAYLVGEAWSDSGVIAAYYQSGLDSLFNFPFSQATGRLASFLNTQTGSSFAGLLAAWQEEIRANNPDALDALFLSNHDQARSAGFLMRNLGRQKMAASLYLLAPGSPFIYYGEELGMTGSGPDENKRLPMHWSATDRAGMTFAPVGATQSIEGLAGADAQLADPASLFSHYRQVLQIRKRHPEIACGTITPLDAGLEEIAAFSLSSGKRTLIVIHNLAEEEQTVSLDRLSASRLKIVEHLAADSGEPTLSGRTLILPPLSTAILR